MRDVMHKHILIIGCLIVFIIGAALRTHGETPEIPSQYSTIAHEILQTESDVLGVTPHYELLDILITQAVQQIAPQTSYSQQDAASILRRIAEILQQHNIRVGDAMLLNETCNLLQADTTGQIAADCDTLSFLYLGIAEVLHLPLRLVSLPQHTFIRWHFPDNTYLNWETTANEVWTDADYLNWYNSTHTDAIAADELGSVTREGIFALVHYNIGNELTQQKRYAEALQQYTRAITIKPDYLNAYYQRGNIWYATGNNDEAIEDFTRVLEENPRDANALQNRGSAWDAKGEYERAIADFTSVLDLNPGNADVLYNRGMALFMNGDYDRALLDFEHVLKLNPIDVDALSYRGAVFSKKGLYDQALRDFNNALEYDPRSAETYNTVAWFLATCPDERYRNGVKAISYAQRALALQPAARMFYLDTLAAGYAEAGRFEQAIVTQEHAIRLLTTADAADDLIDAYTQRLELYQAHQPYRE
jgi:tetratricopeptide (TPR) repeat protein